MYKILKKEHLSASNYLMDIDAPMIAKSGKPGQFVIVIDNEKGERIPLTIADLDPEKGILTIVFQAVGASTMALADLNEGDELYCCVGPLGRPSDLVDASDEELKEKKIIFIAGGVGIAPVYPQVKYMKSRGYDVDVIMGGRTKDLVFWEDKMRLVAKNVYVCTDDGSYGFKGNVTQLLRDLIDNQGKEYNHAVIIGPVIMMKFGCLTTKEYGIKTTAYTLQAAGIQCTKKDFAAIEQNTMRAPDNEAAKRMEEKVDEYRRNGESTGGIIECVVKGVPAGFGEPVFDKLDADIAKAILSIGAVKGIEFGAGFAAADSTGSENNDKMRLANGKPVFETNNAGGILGGISNGNDIVFSLAVKPVPSIFKNQETICKTDNGFEETNLEIKGRHDVCLCPRIVPVVEAMTNIVIADMILRNRCSK